MKPEDILEQGSKDEPIIATGPADHPQLAQLPEWLAKTIAVLSTIDGGPHAIPVAAPVRAGGQRILVSLERTRGSLARLRANPHVAVAILSSAIALSQHSGAPASFKNQCQMRRIMWQSKIDVEEIDDHRSPGVVGGSGVRVQFADDAELSLRKRIDGLR